ncbi:hypothetical protein AB4851_24060 [Burkholderia sp. 22PA0099]|uniref:hypothetical protein n=1 Tax=Burkholderia sp. 22PA0099 TaxID=3237372 RepID=UPI0039C4CC32
MSRAPGARWLTLAAPEQDAHKLQRARGEAVDKSHFPDLNARVVGSLCPVIEVSVVSDRARFIFRFLFKVRHFGVSCRIFENRHILKFLKDSMIAFVCVNDGRYCVSFWRRGAPAVRTRRAAGATLASTA